MGKKPKPDQRIVAIQQEQARLLRKKEIKTDLEKAARERSIINAQNARTSGLSILDSPGLRRFLGRGQ